MAEENGSEDKPQMTDLAGVGALVKAIPEESRVKIVDSALMIIAPLTATMGGLGDLITARFATWTRTHQIRAAKMLKAASDRSPDRPEEAPPPSPRVICTALALATEEPSGNIQELWTNLIANELSGEVHPEFVDILGRLSHSEALRLLEIASQERKWPIEVLSKALGVTLSFTFRLSAKFLSAAPHDFLDAHLERLGLVAFGDSAPTLTLIGSEFLRCVSDPSFELPSAEEP